MTAPEAAVLGMVADGGKAEAIAKVNGWDVRDVISLAKANGYALDAGKTGRFVPIDQAVTTDAPLVVDIIARGKVSTSPKVRRAAAKAELAVSALIDALRADDAEQERRARIAKLEAELARLKRKTTPTVAADAPAIRAWAAENGIDCPPRGPVPAKVLAAYQGRAA